MATALKFRGQKHINHTLCQTHAHNTSTKSQHIGIVVTTGHFGHIGVGAKGTTNASYLVGRDGNANATGANDDALFAGAVGHSFSGGLAKDGVVTAVCVGTATVQNLMALAFQIGLNLFLVGESAVVATDR